jgi:hypothetical protein
MKQALAVFLVAIALSGCARSVTILAKDDAVSGKGTAGPAAGSGELSLLLGGKTYKGQWANTPAPGGGGGIAEMTGAQMIGVSARQDSATALLLADDGGTLRCDILWSSGNETGNGTCRDSDGRAYELRIR